jgi:hypothetical protein
MTIEEIREECERQGIGQRFMKVLLAVCRRVATTTSYEVVDVFNHGLPWTDDALEELAQEVVAERLWPRDQEQLHYVLTTAQSEDELRRLLSVQVKRALSRRRGNVASDRLLDRVRNLADTDSYIVWRTPDAEWISTEVVAEPVPLIRADVREAIGMVAKIPRLPTPSNASRESMVYAPKPFKLLVGQLVSRFGAVDFRSLREIFEEFLTPRNPAGLREGEEIPDSNETPESATQRTQMQAEIDQRVIDAAHAMDPVRRGILIGKYVAADDEGLAAPLTDGALGQALGRSRQTIIKQKELAVEDVRTLIGGLPSEFREDATSLLLETLVALEVNV